MCKDKSMEQPGAVGCLRTPRYGWNISIYNTVWGEEAGEVDVASCSGSCEPGGGSEHHPALSAGWRTLRVWNQSRMGLG